MLARQLLEHQSLPRRLHTVVAVRNCYSRYMTAKLGQAHGCVGSECDHAPQFLLVELAIRVDVELVEEFLDADRVALRDVVEVLLHNKKGKSKAPLSAHVELHVCPSASRGAIPGALLKIPHTKIVQGGDTCP